MTNEMKTAQKVPPPKKNPLPLLLKRILPKYFLMTSPLENNNIIIVNSEMLSGVQTGN